MIAGTLITLSTTVRWLSAYMYSIALATSATSGFTYQTRLCSESADLRLSAGSLPKCWGFISLSGSVISPSDGVKIGRWPHENAKKSLKIRNPYPGLDQH